jgi:hypothetical protein
MSEPMRDPMRRQLTSGRRITPAALLPGEPRPSTETSIPGHLCEVCLDAPAVAFVPAPWGGEMGSCAACAGLPPTVPAATRAVVPGCLICAQPPGPDEDATAYVQHCFDTGHPLRPGALQIRPGVRINLRGA